MRAWREPGSRAQGAGRGAAPDAEVPGDGAAVPGVLEEQRLEAAVVAELRHEGAGAAAATAGGRKGEGQKGAGEARVPAALERGWRGSVRAGGGAAHSGDRVTAPRKWQMFGCDGSRKGGKKRR